MVYHMISLDRRSMEQTLTVRELGTFFGWKQHIKHSILIKITLSASTDSVCIAED